MNLIQRVTEFSGFGNGKGGVSFNKMVTFTMLWICAILAILSIVYLKQQPGVALIGLMAGVLCAGFGFKGISAWLQTRRENYQGTENVTVNAADVAKALTAARNTTEGYQPSGKVPQVYHD